MRIRCWRSATSPATTPKGLASACPACRVTSRTDTQLVRIALAAGDRARALDAVEQAERRSADHPGIATMAGVAAHARGLFDCDPDAFAAAVECHRAGGRLWRWPPHSRTPARTRQREVTAAQPFNGSAKHSSPTCAWVRHGMLPEPENGCASWACAAASARNGEKPAGAG